MFRYFPLEHVTDSSLYRLFHMAAKGESKIIQRHRGLDNQSLKEVFRKKRCGVLPGGER